MSKDLRQRGFTFVGSTICYAQMQATGMVNDHAVDCFRRQRSLRPMLGWVHNRFQSTRHKFRSPVSELHVHRSHDQWSLSSIASAVDRGFVKGKVDVLRRKVERLVLPRWFHWATDPPASSEGSDQGGFERTVDPQCQIVVARKARFNR